MLVNQVARSLWDTVVYKKDSQTFISLPLLLTNNSDETLKYMDVKPHSEMAYVINADGVSILQHDSEANFPDDFRILPHQAATVFLPVIFDYKISVKPVTFRVGMSLQKFTGRPPLDDFGGFFYKLEPGAGDMIWSNEVEVPVN